MALRMKQSNTSISPLSWLINKCRFNRFKTNAADCPVCVCFEMQYSCGLCGKCVLLVVTVCRFRLVRCGACWSISAGAVRVRLICAVVCVAVLLHCLCVTVSSVVRQSSCNDRDV
jgi:hypothetical protein